MPEKQKTATKVVSKTKALVGIGFGAAAMLAAAGLMMYQAYRQSVGQSGPLTGPAPKPSYELAGGGTQEIDFLDNLAEGIQVNGFYDTQTFDATSDDNGDFHLAYINQAQGDDYGKVIYAKWSATGFTTEAVGDQLPEFANQEKNGRAIQIALDSNGRPAILVKERDRYDIHSKGSTQNWAIYAKAPAEAGHNFIDFRIDGSNNIHIVSGGWPKALTYVRLNDMFAGVASIADRTKVHQLGEQITSKNFVLYNLSLSLASDGSPYLTFTYEEPLAEGKTYIVNTLAKISNADTTPTYQRWAGFLLEADTNNPQSSRESLGRSFEPKINSSNNLFFVNAENNYTQNGGSFYLDRSLPLADIGETQKPFGNLDPDNQSTLGLIGVVGGDFDLSANAAYLLGLTERLSTSDTQKINEIIQVPQEGSYYPSTNAQFKEFQFVDNVGIFPLAAASKAEDFDVASSFQYIAASSQGDARAVFVTPDNQLMGWYTKTVSQTRPTIDQLDVSQLDNLRAKRPVSINSGKTILILTKINDRDIANKGLIAQPTGEVQEPGVIIPVLEQ